MVVWWLVSSSQRSTYDVRRAGAVRVRRGISGAPGASVAVGGGAQNLGRLPRVPLVYHQVDGHLALEAADVPVAEVVAELVHLKTNKKKAHQKRIFGVGERDV